MYQSSQVSHIEQETQANEFILFLCSHAETIISHAVKIPCCFSKVPS